MHFVAPHCCLAAAPNIYKWLGNKPTAIACDTEAGNEEIHCE
jgi:hypothetical protein